MEGRVAVRGYGPEVRCGIVFRKGVRYLAYAHDNESQYVSFETGFCDATKPLAYAQADLPRSARRPSRCQVGHWFPREVRPSWR